MARRVSSPMSQTRDVRAGAVSPMRGASRSPSPMPSREVRRPDTGRMPQEMAGPVLRQGPPNRLPARPTQDPPTSEQFATAGPGRLQNWQDEVNRGGQTFQFAQHPPAPSSSLQMELKNLRSSLEKHHAQASLFAIEKQQLAQQAQQVQRNVSGPVGSDVAELRAMVASQQNEQTATLQLLKSEVDVLRKHLLTLCELEGAGSASNSIDDLRNAVADHQQQQEIAYQSTHSDIKILMHDMGTLKQEFRLVQELVVSTKSSVDTELKQLRHEVEGKLTHQEVQVKSMHAEIKQTLEAAAQKDSSSLVDEVQRMYRQIEDLRSQHGMLITAVDAELKNFQQALGEKEATSATATESRFTELRNCVQEHRNEALGTWSKFQAEMERLQKRQNEECLDVVNRSNELLAQTQSDMNTLRDLFDKKPVQQDNHLQQESLSTMKGLQAEIEQLRRKHDELQSELAKQDSSAPSQAQSELREVRSALQQQQALQDQAALAQQIAKQAQRLEVEAVQQQLKEQKARLDALGSASKSLQEQMGDLSDFTKQGIASVQQLTTQSAPSAAASSPDHDGEVAALKTEIEALKLQISMQRSFHDVEVAKKAGALNEQLHEVVGSEREARMQESIETRSLIKSLYEETSRLAKQVKADRNDLPSARTREPEAASTTSGVPARPAFSSVDNGSFKHIDVTRFIGVAHPDSSSASRHSV